MRHVSFWVTNDKNQSEHNVSAPAAQRSKRRRRAFADQNLRTAARIPARRSLRWTTPLLSPEQIGVFRCGRVVQTKLRRPQKDALGKSTTSQKKQELCAEQVLTLAVGNNVGMSLGESLFASMTYAAWCARRAVAFDAISMTCRDGQRNKVRFKPKSAFQSGTQPCNYSCPPPRRHRISLFRK